MGLFVFAAIFAASTAVSYVMSQQAMKKAKKAAADMAGVLINKESNIEPIPVIYGERRVGGVRVFVSTRDVIFGDPNEYLYIALAMAEGEVESITDIHLDDKPITDSKYSGLYTINVHTGADNQAYDPLLTEANAGWTSSHKLSGVAYLAIKLKWNEDVFSGMPEITAVVKGRKVFDPRDSSTAWSNNPALCIRDYLTNDRYGKGLPASAIDDDAFEDAADDCDQTVTFYLGGSTGKIFECNAVLQTDETLFNNLEKMLMGCRGFLPYSQGQYGLIIDKSRSSVFAFDEETIVGGIAITGETKESKFNRVLVKFANPEVDYQPDQAVWPVGGSTQEAALLAEDNGTLLVEEIDLDTTTNYYAARDLARVILRRSRNAIRASFNATSESLQLTVADVVTVTHSTPGWTAKPFQVESIVMNYDGTCSVSLLEYDSSLYTYDTAAEQTDYPDTELPDPFSVTAPIDLSVTASTTIALDGTIVPAITISWVASTDSFVSQYELAWSTDNTTFESIITSNVEHTIAPAVAGATYYTRVRAISAIGAKSDAITANGASSGDTTAPAVVSSPSATGGQGSITLAWTNPADKDFSNAEIYRSTATDGTYTAIASVSGGYGLASSFVNGSLSDSTQYFYKIKSVDYSGNKSAFTAVVDATTSAPASPPRADNGYVYYTVSSANAPSNPSATSYNYDTAAFAGLTANWQKNPPTINGADGKFWASSFTITEASFGGSQTITFSTPFASTQFDGLVTFTNLNTELANASSTEITTINGGLLKTGTIEGDRIRIDGVGIDVVTDGTQKTLQIGDDGVTTVKIDDLAVTEGKIANLAVDTLKIADNAVYSVEMFDTTVNVSLPTVFSSNTNTIYSTSWNTVNEFIFDFTNAKSGQTVLFMKNQAPITVYDGNPPDDPTNQRVQYQSRLLRGTTVVWTGDVIQINNPMGVFNAGESYEYEINSMGAGATTPDFLFDVPNAGNLTYKLQSRIVMSTGYNGASVTQTAKAAVITGGKT